MAGGSGFVGRAVCRALERGGYRAVIVSRRLTPAPPGPLAWLPAPLASLLSPGWSSTTWSQRVTWEQLESSGLPPGTVGVVNCSGQNVLDPLRRWGERLQGELYSSRVGTNQRLARAIARAANPPLAFISMSGAAYYPPCSSVESGCSETSGGGEHSWMARLSRDWEAATELPPSVPTRSVQLRSGVVLGREGGLVQQTILPFYLGLGGRMGSGSQYMPWIHVKDLASLVVHCLETPSCSGPYNAVSPHIVTNSQFVTAFAKTLRRPAIFPAPEFVFRVMFGQERAGIVCDSQVVLPERTVESGFTYQYPSIEEACAEFAHLSYIDTDSLSHKDQFAHWWQSVSLTVILEFSDSESNTGIQ